VAGLFVERGYSIPPDFGPALRRGDISEVYRLGRVVLDVVRRGYLLIQPFKLTLTSDRRGLEKSSGPPLFEPSLKVEGDTGHVGYSGFVAPVCQDC
jgi:hypothetical protein